jgi:prepilin-type N-terminal cleavage/methylation domain-containing protein
VKKLLLKYKIKTLHLRGLNPHLRSLEPHLQGFKNLEGVSNNPEGVDFKNLEGVSRNSKGVAAFTLLELLVGMIISSIVLAAAFSAWNIVGRQHALYRSRHDASTEASFFCSTLRRDFSRADFYNGNSDMLTLQLGTQTLTYKNSPPVVLRNNGLQTDTFFVMVNRWTYTTGLADSSSTASVQLELSVNNTPLPLLLTRQRSAAEQLQQIMNSETSGNGY